MWGVGDEVVYVVIGVIVVGEYFEEGDVFEYVDDVVEVGVDFGGFEVV